jgi:fibronectin-binding autotransporter adhesin
MNIHSSSMVPTSRASKRSLHSRKHLRRRALASGILPVGLLLSIVAPSWGDAIFAPADQILGGQKDGSNQFLIGVEGTAAATNNWPTNEAPFRAIDGFAQKYLNFGITNTGFLVSPGFNGGNGSVVSSMQLWTANDQETRDPSSYELWGTNATLDFGATTFDLNTFTLISSGTLALPTGRGGTGTTALNNTNSQTITFPNSTGYKGYVIVFPTVKNTPAAANSMQIGEVQLFGIAAFTEVKWNGNVSNVWNVNSTPNWLVGGNPSTFSNTNGALFDDTATGSTTITIQNGGTAVQPAAVNFANNTKNYTISGDAVSSVGNMILNGTGSVTLNNTNSFAAGIQVNAGTLNVGATGSLGSGAISVNNNNAGPGSAVAVNFASAQSIGSLSGTIATPASGVNTATINLNGALTVNQVEDGVYAGVIAGPGSLIKSGTGALTLTGTNTYAGPTIINQGTLRSSAPGDNPNSALPAGQPVTVNSGASLILGADDGLGYFAGSVSNLTVNEGLVLGALGTHSTLPATTLNASTITAVDAGNFSNGSILNYILDGDVTTVAAASPSLINANSILLRKATTSGGPSAPVTFNVPRGTAAVDLQVSSIIKDQAAGLIKSGSGILALSNSNQYTGPTIIESGTVRVNDSTAFGTGPVTINNGAVLSLGADTINGFENFSINGGATVDSNQTLTLTTNAGNQARSAFTGAGVSFQNGFTTSFVYTAGGNRAADGFTFTVQNSAPTAIGGGGGGLGYVGIPNSAAVEFNIYTGGGQPVGTTYAVNAAGGYTPSAPVDLASGNPIQITLTYNPLDLTITETLVDMVTRSSYTNTFTGVDLPTVVGGTTGFIGFTGATGGAVALQTISNFSFNNSAQALVVTNPVNAPAASTIALEVLPLGKGGAGSARLAAPFSIGNGATLNITGGATATDLPYTLTINAPTISGSATINVANNGTGRGLLTLGPTSEATPGSTLTKTGPGTLSFLGPSSYTGLTSVNGGTLAVNGSISGATMVNNGGTLGGVGTLAAVTVQNGGTIAPGNSIGTLTSGPVTFLNGSGLGLEISTLTTDQLRINGGATLTGIINLAISLLADPTDFTTFLIVDGNAPLTGYAGGARLSYLGNPLDESEQFTVVGDTFLQVFSISYLAGGGNDVTLTAIPEPSSMAVLLGGMGVALGLRRRRAKR